MILYIAEKPSLGRAIADALPRPHKKQEGCIKAANGDVVSWCFGHLLEQAEPDTYDEKYKRWRREDLPIIPDEWKLVAKPKTRKQLSLLRKLVKEADQLVHAGDPDREGQLLVDEVVDFLKVPQYKRRATKRVLINDLNPHAVKKALQNLRDNQDFIPLSVSALARSRADWLYGMNLTRAYTLAGQNAGYKGVLSVGRVQTPVLGLVVERDNAIDDFVSKPFYEVLAHIRGDAVQDEQAVQIKAKWVPSEACAPYQDEDGRVLHKPLCENVVARIAGQAAHLNFAQRKDKKQSPPLPYSLSSLQIDAGKRFGMSAQTVLDVCQSLYEKHTLITYPRSDSRYLPNSQRSEAPKVVSAVESVMPELLSLAGNLLDTSRKSKAWNDKKVDAHHAIIPTTKKMSPERLSSHEERIYGLVATQYLMQFMPDHTYRDTEYRFQIAGGRFDAKGKETQALGWKQLQKRSASAESKGDEQTALPYLNQGDTLLCERGEVLEKTTQPPSHFTDATLLAAMTGISRYVKDKAIKAVLKETDGLGTEATRAGIIELLFKRHFLQRQGKSIRATEAGKVFIGALPDLVSRPDMTAKWEQQLGDIAGQQLNYDGFMQPLLEKLNGLLGEAEHVQFSNMSALAPAKTATRKRRSYSKSSGAKTGAKAKAGAKTRTKTSASRRTKK